MKQYDIRAICRAYFEIAKERYSASLFVKILVFIVGVLSLIPIIYEYSRLITFFLVITSEFLSYLSDKNKGIAETLLRKLDAQDSFGWSISKAEISDIIVTCPSKSEKLNFKDAYFASKEAVGTKRALENVQESAWWSKHLAQRMGHFYLIGTVLFVIIWLGVVFVGTKTIHNANNLSVLLNILVLALMLLFSLSLLRSMDSYRKFSNAAKKIEETIQKLLSAEDIHEYDAIKIMFEYQLARNNAPLLPSWLWKSMRDNLNETWQQYRTAK